MTEGVDAVAVLTRENDVLRERVALLEQLLFGSEEVAPPLEWRLTAAESRVFCALLARDRASKDHLLWAMHNGRPGDEPELKIIDVLVCKIRAKLKPFGVAIHTIWGFGYCLDAETKARFRALSRPQSEAAE